MTNEFIPIAYFASDDTIIGHRDQIIILLNESIKKGWIDDEDTLAEVEELIEDLRKQENKPLKCVYHPMGSWYIAPLDTH